MTRPFSLLLVLLTAVMLISACAGTLSTPLPLPVQPGTPAPTGALAGCTLRLATTTSTDDSGLLDAILPDFEQKYHCQVDVVAVGTGQALEIGSKGDADVVLVHARAQEDKFVEEGNARERFDVMYNDFVLVGPQDDPAGVMDTTSGKAAFKLIADKQATFASRGDKSGTNTKELNIWASAGITPTAEMKWYNALGQGMGETLLFANEHGSYTLTDRGTYLSMRDKLPELVIVLGGSTIDENPDKALYNPYGVMAVNPDKHPGVQFAMATNFVNWIISPETQKAIGEFGVAQFGQPLFYPNAQP